MTISMDQLLIDKLNRLLLENVSASFLRHRRDELIFVIGSEYAAQMEECEFRYQNISMIMSDEFGSDSVRIYQFAGEGRCL